MKNILDTIPKDLPVGEVMGEEAERLLSDILNETPTTIITGSQAEGMNSHFYRKQRIINDVIQGKKLIVLDHQCECRKLAEALCGEIKEQKILFNLPR